MNSTYCKASGGKGLRIVSSARNEEIEQGIAWYRTRLALVDQLIRGAIALQATSQQVPSNLHGHAVGVNADRRSELLRSRTRGWTIVKNGIERPATVPAPDNDLPANRTDEEARLSHLIKENEELQRSIEEISRGNDDLKRLIGGVA